MANTTTFTTDYLPHELSKHMLPAKLPYIPPTQSMQSKSMYTQDYPVYNDAAPAVPVRRSEQTKLGGKFDAMPTYTKDYRQWEMGPHVKHGPINSWAPPTDPMESKSTQKRDFIGQYAPKRDSMRPMNAAMKPTVPMASDTQQRASYIAHSVERRSTKMAMPYNAPTVPMATGTTQRADFTSKTINVRESMRPRHNPNPNKEPLATASEARDRYVAWNVDRPVRHQPPKWVKPDGTHLMQTTTRTDYVETNGRPAAPFMPKGKREELGEFDGNTNYRSDFRTWPYTREHHKKPDNYMKPEVPFDGSTTFSNHYKQPTGVQPAKSCKPNSNRMLNAQPLDGRTTYGGDYVTKSMKESVRYPTPEWFKTRDTQVAA